METAQSQSASYQWFYESNGERKGPVGEDMILALIGKSGIGRASLVWRTGMPSWVPLHSTDFSRHFPDLPPPLSGNVVRNTIVWWLAFAPALGTFAAGLLSGLSEVAIDRFWWTTLVLNIVLSIADERYLKKAGWDTSKMGSAWLVPVYLFKRAKVLGQSNAYFVVWCVVFALSLFGAW